MQTQRIPVAPGVEPGNPAVTGPVPAGDIVGVTPGCIPAAGPIPGGIPPCIPPAGEDPRPHFRLLRDLRDRLGLRELSMGMSADWRIALEEGARVVRIGTAIFGERPARP